jgi:MOSC domain-containing protein YiiM
MHALASQRVSKEVHSPREGAPSNTQHDSANHGTEGPASYANLAYTRASHYTVGDVKSQPVNTP